MTPVIQADRPGGIEDGPRPEPEPFAPTEDEDAYMAGFGVGIEGEDGRVPAGWSPSRVASFERGLFAGHVEFSHRRLLKREHEARQEQAAFDPRADWSPDEVIRAVGVAESRTPTTP